MRKSGPNTSVRCQIRQQMEQNLQTIANFESKEAQWEQALAEAAQELHSQTKSNPGVVDLTDEADSDAMVTEAIQAEQAMQAAAAKRMEETTALSAALQQAKEQADAELAETQRESTPRRQNVAEGGAAPPPLAP